MSLRVKPQWCWLLGSRGVLTSYVCLFCICVFWCKLEYSCGHGGSYVQVPITGNTDILGQLLGRLPEPSCWEDPPCTDVYLYSFKNGLPSCSAREGRRIWPLVLSVCDCSVFLSMICLSSHVYMYICIYVVNSCVLCT